MSGGNIDALLHRVFETLRSEAPAEARATTVVELLHDQIPQCVWAGIYVRRADATDLRPLATHGNAPAQLNPGEGAAGDAAASGQIRLRGRLTGALDYLDLPAADQTEMGVPLLSRDGRTIGALAVALEPGAALESAHAALLVSTAGLLGPAVQ